MDAASRPAVVIDNGTGYTKMGFSGNVEPCFIIPTVVAVNESFLNQSRSSNKANWLAQYNAGVMADLDFFIGEEALSRSRSSSTYNLSYPINEGQVENWDTMERFWQQCIFNYLRCDPEDHYFLLTESPLTAPENREYTGEIMFETFNVPGLYIAVQPVLALAAGYTTSKCEMTGVVVDVGDGATHIVPVAEGYVIGNSIKSVPISGKDVTLFIQKLMKERGENLPPEDSFDVARKVKEMHSYTCSDIVKIEWVGLRGLLVQELALSIQRFHPAKKVTPRITEIIKSLFDGPYYSWRKVPNQVQEIWFREFTKYFIWLPEHSERVRKNFGTRCSCRLRDMFTDLRKSGQKPAWIDDDVWLQLLAEWGRPEYVQMREKNKQNRASDAEGSGTSLHTGGSIPHTEHRRRLQELGREPTMAELHQRTHQRQANKEWVDQRSSTVHSEYMRLREQSQASEGQASQIADLDAWREAAGGKKKGRIYGLGSVGHGASTSSQSAHSVDSSGSTLETLIKRAIDPFARQFEEQNRRISQLSEEIERMRRRPNVHEEDDDESTD